MRHEHRREALLGERVHRVERLGCGTGAKLDERACRLEPQQPIGKPMRRLADLRGCAIGGELPPGREQKVRESGCDRRQHEQQPALEPASEPARLDQEPGEHRHRGLDEDVTVPDVNQFVGDDPLELGRGAAVSRPALTASDEPFGPRPAAKARGCASVSRYSRGRGTPTRAARRSTID